MLFVPGTRVLQFDEMTYVCTWTRFGNVKYANVK